MLTVHAPEAHRCCEPQSTPPKPNRLLCWQSRLLTSLDDVELGKIGRAEGVLDQVLRLRPGAVQRMQKA